MSENNIDIYETEYGPYGFYSEVYEPEYGKSMTDDETILIRDAWGHEYIVCGYTYNNYEEWEEDVKIACDDEEFVDGHTDYLDALKEYEEIVYDIVFYKPLFKENVDPMVESKKVVNELLQEGSQKKLQDIISPDWDFDFSEDGRVWWVCNEKEGVAEEFDTYSEAVQFILNFEEKEKLTESEIGSSELATREFMTAYLKPYGFSEIEESPGRISYRKKGYRLITIDLFEDNTIAELEIWHREGLLFSTKGPLTEEEIVEIMEYCSEGILTD